MINMNYTTEIATENTITITPQPPINFFGEADGLKSNTFIVVMEDNTIVVITAEDKTSFLKKLGNYCAEDIIVPIDDIQINIFKLKACSINKSFYLLQVFCRDERREYIIKNIINISSIDYNASDDIIEDLQNDDIEIIKKKTLEYFI